MCPETQLKKSNENVNDKAVTEQDIIRTVVLVLPRFAGLIV